MTAEIRAIEYHLPERVLSNEDLAAEFPEWSVEKIEGKTGIRNRHIAAQGECASDLALAAARKLFASGCVSATQIDYILLCTQSPDYFLPTTACVLQDELGIPTSAGALDFNLGCSGYIYGLGLAQGLIETGQASNVLLITAETYSKFIYPQDKSVRTLFGDAAAVTWIARAKISSIASTYVFGTDGRGAGNLIVPAGGMRQRSNADTAVVHNDDSGNSRSQDDLYMNGAEIFSFTLRAVPESLSRLLDQSGKKIGDIDLFIFHQANHYMLEHLRKKLGISKDRFYVWLEDCGNTVSSTIPIALKHAVEQQRLRPGHLAALVGFGVGYSWGATLVQWPVLGYSVSLKSM